MAQRNGGVGELLEGAVRAGLAPGFAALAARGDGQGRCWCAGVRRFGGEPVDAALRFDLASLTKPLAATTLLLLARRDGLDLDAPLADALPELAGTPWAGATFAQCATHTAGFPAWVPLYALGPRSREAYLASLRGVAPVAPLGARVEYSCLGFIAIGIALERAAGATLGELFRELVAEPLGLSDEIGFAPAPDTPAAAGESEWFVEARLLAERGLGGRPPAALTGALSCDDGNARGLGGEAGNAGLFGTAAAVARLAAEFLPGGGELLAGAEAELATRCLTAGMEQPRGLGWQLAAAPGCSAGPALPPDGFGHAGFTGTSVWVDPGERRVMVLLGNRLHPGGKAGDLHPLRRRFHALAARALADGAGGDP